MSTVGRIHPHLEARVVDPASGKTVPVGTVSERWPAPTAAALSDWVGWEHCAHFIIFTHLNTYLTQALLSPRPGRWVSCMCEAIP